MYEKTLTSSWTCVVDATIKACTHNEPSTGQLSDSRLPDCSESRQHALLGTAITHVVTQVRSHTRGSKSNYMFETEVDTENPYVA